MPAGTPGATPPAERRGADGRSPRRPPKGAPHPNSVAAERNPAAKSGAGSPTAAPAAARTHLPPGWSPVDRNARRRWSGRELRRGAIEGRHLLGGLLVARCSGSGAGLGHRRIRLPLLTCPLSGQSVVRPASCRSVGSFGAHHVPPSSRSAIPPLAAPGVVSRRVGSSFSRPARGDAHQSRGPVELHRERGPARRAGVMSISVNTPSWRPHGRGAPRHRWRRRPPGTGHTHLRGRRRRPHHATRRPRGDHRPGTTVADPAPRVGCRALTSACNTTTSTGR